jgi:hypothetical protein
MSLSAYSKRCEYNNSEIKKSIYLLEKTKVGIRESATRYTYSISNNTGVVEEYKVEDFEFTQSSTYGRVYKYSNSLSITFNTNSFGNIISFFNKVKTDKYYVFFKSDGMLHLFNFDSLLKVTTNVSIKDSEDANTYQITLETKTNIPILVNVISNFTNTYVFRDSCEYLVGKVQKLYLTTNNPKTTDYYSIQNPSNLKAAKIEFDEGSLELTETFDGKIYNISLSFQVTLNTSSRAWINTLADEKRYKALIETDKMDFNVFYEFPAKIDYDISVSDGNTHTITVKMNSISNTSMLFSNII